MFLLALWGGLLVDSILFWIFAIMTFPFLAIGMPTRLDKERTPEEPVQGGTEPEIGEPETSSPVSPLELVCPYCGYKSPYYARICARCGRHPGEIVSDEATPEEVESETSMPVSFFDVLCFYCSHENPRDA